MSARTTTLLVVACLAVLAAAVGGVAPVGAVTAVDEPDAGDPTVGGTADAGTGLALGQADDDVTFEREGPDVVVSVPVSRFERDLANASATLSLVGQNGTLPPRETQRTGDEYVFRARFPQLVGDTRITDRRVRVRLSWASGSANGTVDARYLEFQGGNAAVRGGSFGFRARAIGFADGATVPLAVAAPNGSGEARANATLVFEAGGTVVRFDPATFAGRVSPLESLRFTAFPDDSLVGTSRRADLRNHAGGGAATFADDGGPVLVAHPLLFPRTEYVVIAETADPGGRYVRRTTASQSGGVGAVSIPRATTAAGRLDVTVRSGSRVVFEGASPPSPAVQVNGTWVNATGSDSMAVRFPFGDAGLPGSVETVWFSRGDRVWSVSENLSADGANLTVAGGELRGAGRYGLLVVGGGGSVHRARANVGQPGTSPATTDSGSPGESAGTDFLPILLIVVALPLGAIVTLLTTSAGQVWFDTVVATVATAVMGLLFWLVTIALLQTFTIGGVGWMFTTAVLGVALAGSVAGSMDSSMDIPYTHVGPLFTVVIVALAAIGGFLLGLDLQWNPLAVAGSALVGALVAFLAMDLLAEESSGAATHDVTVRLVDPRTREQTNATLEVTAQRIGGRTATRSREDRFTVTDGQGVQPLPDGQWQFTPSRGSQVTETIQGRTAVEIPVDPTRVQYEVRNPNGDPVEGATVSLLANGRERQLTTDGDGVATDQLPAGTGEVEVTIDHERYESASGRRGATNGLNERVTLQPLTGGLEAVVSLDGEDVPDVTVVAEPEPDVVGGTERVRTDRKGRAAFDSLPIGEYTVSVDLSSVAQEFSARSARVTVLEDQTRTEGLTVRFEYRLSGEARRRIEDVRDRLDAMTSHPRSDMSIPAFYASVVEELLRTAERVPREGATLLASGESPTETIDALLTAAEAGAGAVDEAMSDKQNVDLFAACADLEPANATWDGTFSLEELFELEGLQAGKQRARVAGPLEDVDDRISEELRTLSEVGPARSAWEQIRELIRGQRREGLEAAAATMLAEALLDAIESLFEREALRERMTRTVF